ncbi:site-specific DNA-methyltransferase [Candidatus Magnetominusculus dajiuhuensis]|uniref:site-specific DNA-methyltransferase n=1 Tax=Candidatus Magnetominusculus dajiuhuensis TaxID=3137712 RepID=UPI003B42962D
MSDAPEKIDGTSLDIAADNRARLKAMFPTVFTETLNDKGELVESVDFEKLKTELGTFTELFESRRERYGMDWPGKKEAMRLIQTTSAATLKPCREESVNFDATENLFIEGDNLEVLKLLQKSYYGKVKMIYIDPPYNTGKEFIYPDNYSESLETYLEYAGLIDGEGRKFSTNTANEGRFHTKWLNMMYPRLYLARNLLRDDGVIFISIDDNEVSNLKKICDEIFGEENFIGCPVWQKKYGPANDAKGMSPTHEFILCYGKNIISWKPGLLERNEEQLSAFKNPDNDSRGEWRASDLSARTFSESGYYMIKGPTGKEFLPPPSRSWIVNEKRFFELLNDNRIIFGADGQGRPMQKKFLSEVKAGITPETWWDREIAGDNKTARYEIKDIFPENIFDTPKPTKLISRVLTIADTKDSDIILDFFSGSATAAHAVLDLNKQDNGNRKFIMVQLPEPCAEDSEAFKAGYKTIADIGKERIRRVIKKLNEEQEGKLDLDGASAQDRGFKVLKLDKSNFKQWQPLPPDATPEQINKQLFDHIKNIEHKASPEDLLFEILIKAGFMPTEKVQTITLADIPVFSIAEGGLLICLADTVTKELINAVAEDKHVQQFICLDKAFGGNDQLKANAVQTFNARNMDKEEHNQIIFRTV